MLYQVFIPALDAEGFNITLKLEAPNWISALRSGLSKLGEQGDVIKNVMVAIQPDGTIMVSDPKTRRVFEIKELGSAAAAPAVAPREPLPAPEPPVAAAAPIVPPRSASPPPAQSAPPAPEPDALPTVVLAAYVPAQSTPGQVVEPVVPEPEATTLRDQPATAPLETELPVAEELAPLEAPTRSGLIPPEAARLPGDQPSAEAVLEEELPIAQELEPVRGRSTAAQREPGDATRFTARPASFQADEGRAVSQDPASQILQEQRSAPVMEDPEQAPRQASPFLTEEVLADVFMEAQTIYEFDTDLQNSVEFALDLLMKKIPAQAGSVLFADMGSNTLYFAAARGPVADEIMQLRVPIGRGLVGFCAKEGVSLAVDDAARDPRFYKRIGEQIGFETRSVVCAPIEAEGRCYGAMELINKQGLGAFTPGEMSIVAYVANRLADHINQVALRGA